MSDDEAQIAGGDSPQSKSGSDQNNSEPVSPVASFPSSPVGSPPASPVGSAPASPTGSDSPVGRRGGDDDDEAEKAASPKSDDSDDDESVKNVSPTKRAVIESDDDDDNQSDKDEPSSSRQKRGKKKALIDSDDSDDDDGEKEEPEQRRNLIGSDASDDDEEKKKKEKTSKVMFGDDSDDDEEKKSRVDEDEFVERNDDEEGIEREEGEDRPKPVDSDDDDDIIDDRGGKRRRDDDEEGGFEWDFDVMMREKKAAGKRRKTKKDGGIDIINDDDGTISRLVDRMKAAAKSDRTANMERKPAFQKIKLLPDVKSMMLKAGITEALIDNGMMSAVSEWLAPLPDKCLPALDIRITLLKLLHNPRFWKLDRSVLKQSGLGKAVMLLYKHPNETRENKMIANKLIGEWARPIFQLDTDYSSMTREERVQKDYERMPAVKKQKMDRNRLNNDDDDEQPREKRRNVKEGGVVGSKRDDGQLKPGDKGYINRARVPKPSTKDYVVRPKWNIEGECKGDRKNTSTSRYDQALRDFQERTRKHSAKRSVTVSLEGRNLAI